jgi:hypothetical protein
MALTPNLQPLPDCGSGELLTLALTYLLLLPLIALSFFARENGDGAVRYAFAYGLWCLLWGLVGAAYSTYYETLTYFPAISTLFMLGLGAFILREGIPKRSRE